ncbi:MULTISPECIES: glycerophosphodiester phosphodiesterase family protein [unclassified Lysobacter]|uniref:glycerophosphodiester phosphodiesterase family protein n=1 Tax=unclassified Lysobacter TaxID=2635362 RepID=UPI001BE511D2|nr:MULTISPECIES: glycerophosphodiester phosphodiesterase family protein [unclassified Lysobacter]MBT2748906.1 glycerophosphodiester phosphodiesterase [Lysobacter sp. ISL-42]MBT2753066.1 glycerophosphodiester phosphodiesterase [Lysobacter sp. ISL-50]MBT2777235.1 glycerophosphodiester phosphodiesterase [Lysobacter sp. ISL-54]MBT2783215.1 glycerophosphodiester phosphodiesterase [Lysobacter sp. ISL-52]
MPHFHLLTRPSLRRSLAALALCAASAAHASAPTPAKTPMTDRATVLGQQGLIVIAHRGASGYRPEHTLEAYRLAIRQGADFIEPDLVATRDGELVVRHENEISGTTDVADHPEFADRKTSKTIDGEKLTGWFTEDFTLAELKTLRAKERIAQIRPGNTRFDGQFPIATFKEVIALARQESRDGRVIGIYPETKHPTWFAREGTHLDGSPIHLSLGDKLVATLVAEGFTDPGRVYIQSFEVANLIELKQRILPKAGIDLPLVQLYGDFERDRPYDFVYNAGHKADLDAIYGGLIAAIPGGIDARTSFAALTETAALTWMKANYVSGLGPSKSSVILRAPLPAKRDADADGRALLSTRNTGFIHPLLGRALALGLQVHPYTLRAEEPFLTQTANGVDQSALGEALQWYSLGVQGFFIDQPDIGVAARKLFLEQSRIAPVKGP